MNKRELDQEIDAQFEQEQRRHKYHKNKPVTKWSYIRPLLFGFLITISLAGLLTSIFALFKAFFLR